MKTKSLSTLILWDFVHCFSSCEKCYMFHVANCYVMGFWSKFDVKEGNTYFKSKISCFPLKIGEPHLKFIFLFSKMWTIEKWILTIQPIHVKMCNLVEFLLDRGHKSETKLVQSCWLAIVWPAKCNPKMKSAFNGWPSLDFIRIYDLFETTHRKFKTAFQSLVQRYS